MKKDDEVLKKLDTIIALLASQGKSDQEKNVILNNLGLTYKERSKMLGIAEGTLKTWDHQKRKTIRKKSEI
ncbi:hypothetical protein HQ529_00995 [Candidatus Woesearchaeota archaeon]|nr:hypothetical protein [Candidatus Woesearchaeota archaeon]